MGLLRELDNANQGPVTSVHNPTYVSTYDSEANRQQTNGDRSTTMATSTDDANRNYSSSAKEHYASLENDIRILALEQIVGPDLDFPNLYNLENTTAKRNKSRKKYATTDFSAMGIDLSKDPSMTFNSPEGESSSATEDDSADDTEKKKKKPDLFADIDFIDDGVEEVEDSTEEEEEEEEETDEETDEIEEDDGGECDSDEEGTHDEKQDFETDRDSETESFDAGTESQSDEGTLTRGSGRGFLSYYTSLETSAARYTGVGCGESPASESVQSVYSDSEVDAKGVAYEPLQHNTPYNSEQQTSDTSTDCESTYEMLYKSFSMRQEHEMEKEIMYNGRQLSPYEGQPDYGYASETSYDEKTPGDLSITGTKYYKGPVTEDLYAIPNKQSISSGQTQHGASASVTTNTAAQGKGVSKSLSLPPGWREVTDSSGTYYWHVPSGTTQWSPPSPVPQTKPRNLAAVPKRWSTGQNYSHLRVGQPGGGTNSDPDSSLKEFQESTLRYASLNIASGKPHQSPSHAGRKSIRFHVRSLGWVEMDEVDLSPGKSSVAVNNCIRQLSYRKNDIRDTAGIWGEGKDMYMVLEEDFLKLVDVSDGSVLNSQPVCEIRVWGVGRDNGRDFAYVAKDKGSKKFKCHVFRCDIPAKAIANALHEICSKVMTERRKTNAISMVTQGQVVHPHTTHIPQSARPVTTKRDLEKIESLPTQVVDFPTPKAEPTTVFRAYYVGGTEVHKANGMDTLNNAIAKLTSKPLEELALCRVEVATSTITVTDIKTKEVLAEHRVRFLSFLGIGPDIRQFAYIMCSGKSQFCCHVFHCEHSAGGLAKTIEAACKLRYQKCLDSKPINSNKSQNNQDNKNWSLGPIMNSVHSLFGKFGSIKRNQNNKTKKDQTIRADG
ncbi:amyloid beta precursor protein binding family B member 2-like isoform X2 [Ptychodera flava]|uniref:amyloid beta precursor protein binding family B member 2-like isoform X2 n=1 Tax=Ptychodera flava TaxID=63121 RepID=UPI00396A0623